jgi:hypothetical protein
MFAHFAPRNASQLAKGHDDLSGKGKDMANATPGCVAPNVCVVGQKSRKTTIDLRLGFGALYFFQERQWILFWPSLDGLLRSPQPLAVTGPKRIKVSVHQYL